MGLETQFLSQRSPNFDTYDLFLPQNASIRANLIPDYVLKFQHNF